MTQSTQAISPLRQRMIDDMRLRKLSRVIVKSGVQGLSQAAA